MPSGIWTLITRTIPENNTEKGLRRKMRRPFFVDGAAVMRYNEQKKERGGEMYDWSAEQMAFWRDALRFTDYYRVIAGHIAPYLPPYASVCDAGCGLGALGLALLPHCRTVTCVDREPSVIADLQKRAPAGLTALCGDVEQCPPPETYDAMVFCLFGSTEQALRIAGRQCRGRIFLVKRDYTHHRFSAGEVPLGDYNAENTARELARRQIPCRTEEFTADFHQPVRSREEARRFFALHDLSDRPLSPAELEARLCPGPTAEFPLCIPHTKQLRLFIIETADIP